MILPQIAVETLVRDRQRRLLAEADEARLARTAARAARRPAARGSPTRRAAKTRPLAVEPCP